MGTTVTATYAVRRHGVVSITSQKLSLGRKAGSCFALAELTTKKRLNSCFSSLSFVTVQALLSLVYTMITDDSTIRMPICSDTSLRCKACFASNSQDGRNSMSRFSYFVPATPRWDRLYVDLHLTLIIRYENDVAEVGDPNSETAACSLTHFPTQTPQITLRLLTIALVYL